MILLSCNRHTGNNETDPKEANIVQDTFENPFEPGEKIALGKVYFDTVEFVAFNDDGDNALVFIQKEGNTIGLIYDWAIEYDFIKGDEIEIQWKMDSIRYAGDPEFLNYTQFLVTAKKLKQLKLTDKKIKFLWRETRYNEALETDINTIILDEEYIKTISEPEKAALAYAATFIGNECEWDGKANDSRSNLKCKILSALDLGYQCSHSHLDFLRFWFRSNGDILKELENCPTTPDGATVQDTFDEINLAVNGNQIIVDFKASGFNLREGKSWNWTEKHHFEFKENELQLMKKEKSPTERGEFAVSGN